MFMFLSCIPTSRKKVTRPCPQEYYLFPQIVSILMREGKISHSLNTPLHILYLHLNTNLLNLNPIRTLLYHPSNDKMYYYMVYRSRLHIEDKAMALTLNLGYATSNVLFH